MPYSICKDCEHKWNTGMAQECPHCKYKDTKEGTQWSKSEPEEENIPKEESVRQAVNARHRMWAFKNREHRRKYNREWMRKYRAKSK